MNFYPALQLRGRFICGGSFIYSLFRKPAVPPPLLIHLILQYGRRTHQ
jgi:hypothetical protein